MEKLRKAREAYELGCKLQAAIERGRELHPWRGVTHALSALQSEVDELGQEVYSGDPPNREGRITSEAIDCAVVAIRIAQRR